jgi:predicted DNA-binding transcriptional regulator YafY
MTLDYAREVLKKHKSRVVRILYSAEVRYVRPYEIKEDNKYNYLFATDITSPSTSIRKFRLDRIETLEVTPMTFTPEWPINL